MPKYENSVIYKIKHNEDYDDNNIYVGSTSNFKNRKNQHKSCCNNEKCREYNFFVYQFIRDNGGWDEWVMIPIEQYSCNSKKELLIRERHHIDILRPTFNIVKPGRTIKEYYEDNKEKVLEYHKQYREENKEYYKQYREENKEYYKQYREGNKEQLSEYEKKYYEVNKEQILEKCKKRYEANKEIINEKANEKVICDHCGCESTKRNLKRHQKTKKCLKSQEDNVAR